MKRENNTAPKPGTGNQQQAPAVALVPRAVTPGQLSSRLDQWRDWYNPLRGQTLANVIMLFDLAQAGITAELQWCYQLMERRYDILMCCIDSTNSALTELNWYVRTTEGHKESGVQFDKKLAEDQQLALRERYNSIKNLYQALEHLALAKYRGYAHVQIASEGQWLNNLVTLNQWNVCREGYNGSWFWNPRAVQSKAGLVDTGNKLDESCYLILENRRPVNEYALVSYLRASMCDKDWDAHLEIYGIPGWVITMPPYIPTGKEDEYRNAATAVAAGGGGALPHGSEAKVSSSPAGEAPFEKRREFLNRQICLVATGGLLTSLALPQGIGSGASDSHGETFKRIARSRSKAISEEFQRKIDAQILNTLFPGKPHLAYFEFDARESTDVGQILEHAATARKAGVQISTEQLSDRTGYTLTDAPMPAVVRDTISENPDQLDKSPGASANATPNRSPISKAKPSAKNDPVAAVASRADSPERLGANPTASSQANDSLAAAAAKLFASANRAGMRPLAEALWPLLDITDSAILRGAIVELMRKFPGIAKQVLGNDASAKVLQDTLSAAAANGIIEGKKP